MTSLTFSQPSHFSKYLTELTHKRWIEDLYMTIYLLAMSTTIINPMVYYTINSKYEGTTLYYRNIRISIFIGSGSIFMT